MRHLLRLIICVFFAATAILSFKHFVEQSQIIEKIRQGQEILRQINNEVDDIKNAVEKSGLIPKAKKDFSHFVSVMSDLIGYIKTGESAYTSGFDAIRGEEK